MVWTADDKKWARTTREGTTPPSSRSFDEGGAKKARYLKARYFSEADWQEIKESLAERGVDLDAQMVGRFVPGKRWWLPDDSAARQPLRDSLQDMAVWYQILLPVLSPKSATPAQHAEALQKGLTEVENAATTIDRMAIDRMEAKDYTDDDYTADLALLNAIARYIDRQQERIARLRAMPSPRIGNARTLHNDYWRELTRLWSGITGSAGPLRRKSLHRFLLACSRTVFPEMAPRALYQKIKGFMSNLSRNKPPRFKSRGA
jgi:hypothetical protein